MTAAFALVGPLPATPTRRWVAVGEPWAPRSVQWVAVVIWLLATALVFQLGLQRAYHDGLAHELIARRVTDSLSPGVAQLGTVWLPLPSLLLAPLVAIEPVWRSGIAGAGLGLLYLQISIVSLYRIGNILGGPAAGWTAVGVLLVNPNVLYLFTTPMLEAPFIAFVCLSGAAVADVLQGFGRHEVRHGAIVAAGLGTAAALLSRYEGWAVAALVGATLYVVGARIFRQRQTAEAVGIGFALIPGAAAGLWLLYNLLIFDDPLAFLRGEHSSQAIMQGLVAEGGIAPYLVEPGRAVVFYGQAILDVTGPFTLILAAVSLPFAVKHAGDRPAFLILAVLAAPLLFYPTMLVLGQSVIIPRSVDPMGLFNVRYAVTLVPFLAVAACVLVGTAGAGSRRAAVLCIGAAALWSVVSLADPMGPVVVAEGILQRRAGAPVSEAARWLAAQPDSGLVLMDDALEPDHQLMALEGGRPLRAFVGSFVPDHWHSALHEPSEAIQWIVVRSAGSRWRANDRVRAALVVGEDIPNYEREFDNRSIAIYRRTAP